MADRVREITAKGRKFTKAEFKALCAHYGNICRRCGERRRLVPDHVVPIEQGAGETFLRSSLYVRKAIVANGTHLRITEQLTVRTSAFLRVDTTNFVGPEVHRYHLGLFESLRIRLPLLLPIIEARHGHFRAFGIGVM